MSNQWLPLLKANCRTCCHSTPKQDGTWRCERFNFEPIPVENQRAGCECHVIHPDLFPYPLDTELSTKDIAAFRITEDRVLFNGEGDANVFSSREIIAGGIEACFNPLVEEARILFDAEIEGGS